MPVLIFVDGLYPSLFWIFEISAIVAFTSPGWRGFMIFIALLFNSFSNISINFKSWIDWLFPILNTLCGAKEVDWFGFK